VSPEDEDTWGDLVKDRTEENKRGRNNRGTYTKAESKHSKGTDIDLDDEWVVTPPGRKSYKTISVMDSAFNGK